MAKPIYILSIIAVAAMFTTGVFGQTVLKGATINSGGKTFESNTMKVRVTVGESIIGAATSATYKMTTGFIGSVGSTNTPLPDLVLVESNVNPVIIPPGGEVKVTFTVKNNGDATLKGPIKIRTYLSNDTHFDPSNDTELPGVFEIEGDLAPNAQAVFPSGSQSNSVIIPEDTPLQVCQFLIVLDPSNEIGEKNDDNNTGAKPFEVSTGTGGSPTFGAVTKPDFFTTDANVSIQVINNKAGLNVRLFHRKLSDATFDNVQMVADGSSYSIALEAGWADETGMEFYFSIPGAIAATSHHYLYTPVPASQTIPELSFGGQLENYRIFSIPYHLNDNNIDEIFKSMGEYDKTQWRIVRYQDGRNVDKKEGLTKIERGQGFWFNAVDKTEIILGAGTTVSKDQSPDFTLALGQGYNQIGDPYTFDVSWPDVLAVNPAVSDKLSQQLLVYNSANVSLEASDKLKAWSGGFVLADEAMTVSIPASLKNGASRISRSVIGNSNPDLDEWMISLTMQQDGVVNSLGAIGMHPDASTSKDIYDIVTPPGFIKYIGMSSQHNDFFQPDFSRDIVTTTAGYNWRFEVESTINTRDAQISWNNNELQSSASVLLMYDVAKHVLVDMKTADRYEFDPQRSTNFRFFFGSDAATVKPDVQDLGMAWPNPVTDVVHVPYLVKERSHIQIEVYDLVGRKVNSIVNGEQEAGYHTATWNRTAFDGSVVSPGVYIYRMNGTTTTGRLIVN